MGHLHRQALLQRAKARDAMNAEGVGASLAEVKGAVNSLSLAQVGDLLHAPSGIHIAADALKPTPAPVSKRKAVRKRGKKRGTKKKA